MPRTVHSEATAVRRAVTRALESAIADYLIECAGQDLPDNQHDLDNYRFEIHPHLTHTSFMVRAMHVEQAFPSFHFEIKVAGS